MLEAWERSRWLLKSLGPCTYMGYPEEAPSFWPQIGSALIITVNWEMNQQKKDSSLLFYLSFFL